MRSATCSSPRQPNSPKRGVISRAGPTRLRSGMSLPRPVRAVVFDMDGLLVDTETVVFRAMQRAADAIARDLPFETFQRMVGLQHAASDLILIEHFGEGFDLDAWSSAVSAHF